MTYRVELTPSDEGYVVSCPELPEVHSKGGTEEEALANIRSAIHAFVDTHPTSRATTAGKLVRLVRVDTAFDPEPQRELKTAAFGLPPEWKDHKFSTLMELLEGPNWI